MLRYNNVDRQISISYVAKDHAWVASVKVSLLLLNCS